MLSMFVCDSAVYDDDDDDDDDDDGNDGYVTHGCMTVLFEASRLRNVMSTS